MNIVTAGSSDADGKNIFMQAHYEGLVGGSSILGNDGYVSVFLLSGRGVFAESIHSGTFALEGAELSSDTCGLCLFLNGIPLGGTVTVDLSNGRLWMQLTNVVLEATDFGALGGRCKSSLPTTIVEGIIRKACLAGESDASQCDAGTTCTFLGDTSFGLCIPRCDPLAPSACAEGEGCYKAIYPQTDPSLKFTCLPAGWIRDINGTSCDPEGIRCPPGSDCLGDLKCHKYCDPSAVDPGCAQGQSCWGQGVGFCDVAGTD